MSSKLQSVLNIHGLVYLSRASSIQGPPYLNANTMGGKLRPHLTVVSGVVKKSLRDDLDVIRAKHHIDSRSKLIAQILEEYVQNLRSRGGLDGGL